MDSALYLGIDIGTSGVRAIAIDESGKSHADAAVSLPTPIVSGQKVEQDPLIWWQVCCEVLDRLSQQIDLTAIQSICIDGTSSTLVLTDEDGSPVTAGMMYNDARATDQLETIKQHAAPDSAVHSATSTLAKVLWCHQQGLLQQAYHIMHQCDWITGQFSRQFGISDRNNVIKLGYDAKIKTWPNWIHNLPVPMEKLPKVLTPGTVIGNIDPGIAKRFGFSVETKICAGTTDSTAGVIAAGINKSGTAVTSLGSTMVLKVLSDKPVYSAEYGVYSQPLFDHWLVGGASNSGGAALLQHFSRDQIAVMTEQLRPHQFTGFDYYPLPGVGERFPINDPSMTSRHTPQPDNDVVFFQALLEGMANIEKRGYDLLATLGTPYPSKVITVGGGANNKAWQSIRAEKLNVPVEVAAQQQAAYGAALLAKKSFQN